MHAHSRSKIIHHTPYPFNQTLLKNSVNNKPTNRLRHIEKINEDASDNDTDEMITFDNDKAKKTYRIGINALRKRANTKKTKKSRTAKINTMNVERKQLLKQRKEKAIQNAKDRKWPKEIS